MEIEKTLRIAASPEQIWSVLLDPHAMAECVPGMQSVEVVSPDEYAALMHVKIAFVSAKFKLRTRIVERREPFFLKAEGTGEDASVASSLKQSTELTLSPQTDGSTELQIRVHVDLLGRMGSFGLSVMKAKADRLWDDFGANLAARLAGSETAAEPVAEVDIPAAGVQSATLATVQAPEKAGGAIPSVEPTAGWWAGVLRAIGIQPAMPAREPGMIVVEIQRPDHTRIKVEWPAQKSAECMQWLREVTH